MLAGDRQQAVVCDGRPHLRLHRVLGRSIKRLDPQVLFDAFEEYLDLPSLLVKLRDGDRW